MAAAAISSDIASRPETKAVLRMTNAPRFMNKDEGTKHLLRRVLYRYVPRALIDRPKHAAIGQLQRNGGAVNLDHLTGTDIANDPQKLPIVDYFQKLKAEKRLSAAAYEKITWRNADRLLKLGFGSESVSWK